MSEEEIVGKVKSDDGHKLVIETPEGREEIYCLDPIKTMYLHVEKLQVFKGDRLYIHHFDWPGEPPQLLHSQPALSPSFYVCGTATIHEYSDSTILSHYGQRSISAIGWDRGPERQLCIKFRKLREKEKLPEGCAHFLSPETNDGKTPNYTYACVGRAADNECSKDNFWYALCLVSPDMLDTISSAVSSGTLREMTVGLNLDNLYWGPMGEHPQRWYLRPYDNPDMVGTLNGPCVCPKTAEGYITHLTLALATVDLYPRPEANPVPKAPVVKPELILAKQINNDLDSIKTNLKSILEQSIEHHSDYQREVLAMNTHLANIGKNLIGLLLIARRR